MSSGNWTLKKIIIMIALMVVVMMVMVMMTMMVIMMMKVFFRPLFESRVTLLEKDTICWQQGRYQSGSTIMMMMTIMVMMVTMMMMMMMFIMMLSIMIMMMTYYRQWQNWTAERGNWCLYIWACQSWSGQLIFFYFEKALLCAQNYPPHHPKLWLKV